MRSYHLILFIAIIFVYGFSEATAQEKGIALKPLGPIPNIQFKKGYAYAALTANNHFLVWMEGYTHTLFIYNLDQKKCKKIQLKKGRGPHEFVQISGYAISMIIQSI